MAEWQRARLIPISGIGSAVEAERRATSALLAVLEVVRDLSIELLSPFGASRAQKATVESYVEVPFDAGSKTVRPDGLIEVSYGKSTWTALVEVKTRDNTLGADQVNAYWDIARDEGFDAVITISNEIAPAPGVHPTAGLHVRSNSRAKVHHLSWTAILSAAVMVKDHHGVEDPEQAWILGELIRYLEHDESGALAFDDMGKNWVQVRKDARDGALQRNDDAVGDLALRWDQLMRYTALSLGAEIGEDVQQVFRRGQKDPDKRLRALIEQLCDNASLDGVLRIPHTAGDLELHADLKARRISSAVEVSAPEDRGGRARCTWLFNQLSDAPDDLMVEAYPKNARTPYSAELVAIREDRSLLLGDERKEPGKFRLVLWSEMGQARGSGGRSPGFIDSVVSLTERFYEDVVQNLSSWRPPAPKLAKASTGLPERQVATATAHPPRSGSDFGIG